MKKIALLTAFISLFVSCSSDITDLNEEAKRPATTKAEYLFTNAQKSLVDQMVGTSVNLNVFRLFAQHWTETTYPDESQYDITTRRVPDNHFAILYRDVLIDLKESKKLLDLEVPASPEQTAILANKKALVNILMAYTYSVLVDTFGDVPYSESLDIEAHPLPKYDDAQTIYKDLITRLTADASSLTANSASASFDSADLIYGGDASKWAKFANSIRLRMAVNMYDIDAAYAKTEIEKAVTAGVITSNADNTNLQYLPLQPNANPLYADLVVSGRNDFIPANTLVDKMNTLVDPRRAKYFTEFPAGSGNYKGGIYGASNAFVNYSHITSTLNDPTFAGTLVDATEVEFLLAEAAAKGAAVGAADTHYNNAVTASFTNWGLTAADATTYLAAHAYDAANYKQSIGEQAWIALFNRGFEAWSSYRRLDFPVLNVPAVTYNGLTEVPKRYSYPAREETINGVSTAAAIAKIPGGNTLTAKIFWDKF
jgi:hypothetical protein